VRNPDTQIGIKFQLASHHALPSSKPCQRQATSYLRSLLTMSSTAVAFLRLTSLVSLLLVGIHAFGVSHVTTGSQRHDTLSLRASSSSSDTLTLFSPCKINLFLRIIQKRPDGFHDLASLFQAIGFGDTLELTPLHDDSTNDIFECNMPGVPVDSSNLVLRALELMREKTGSSLHFKANLMKQVPAQAGLGGGSANAATAMWGANQLMGKPASLEQVCRGVVVISVVSYSLSFHQTYSTSLTHHFLTISKHSWSNGPATWDPTLHSSCLAELPIVQDEEKS